VKVTACPLVEGLGAEVSVVFVFALCTTCVKPGTCSRRGCHFQRKWR
jgi:hypothetical protein